MNNEIFEARVNLILDYISQILVYGSNTNGSISLEKHKFDDGKYLIMTVSVIQNSYFRWHDLGIKSSDSKKFYNLVFNKIVEKFKKFSIIINNNCVDIKSSVNNNQIRVSFSINTKTEIEWFNKIKDNK